jgi:hypothetical protein
MYLPPTGAFGSRIVGPSRWRLANLLIATIMVRPRLFHFPCRHHPHSTVPAGGDMGCTTPRHRAARVWIQLEEQTKKQKHDRATRQVRPERSGKARRTVRAGSC